MSKHNRLQLMRPLRSDEQLHAWLNLFLGIYVPRTAVCAGHDAPFAYVRRAYFEPASDQVVWAPRGGGKTRLAAAVTLLDLLHKPAIACRILGGSLEQSLKMWEHLLPDLQRLAGDQLPGPPRSRRVTLRSGATAAVLTQSQRAVRGLRVQKLRCDEVELFKPDIWQAAQLVTRSLKSQHGGGIAGTVEALSTLHTPWGLMNRVIDDATQRGTAIVRWCLMEVLERCPPDRDCATCPLWTDCQGVAKSRCSGFVRIDDAIAMKQRVSIETWEAEMLCRRPGVVGSVFPRFDLARHVREAAPSAEIISLAMDFGFANPFVCLWIASSEDGAVTHVLDEYVQPGRTLLEHLEHLRNRPWRAVQQVSCDPAGAGRNEQTATSNVALLRKAGYRVRYRASRIVDGIELIRAALAPASGEPTLSVHPRCKRLIRALQAYRYPPTGGELPLKDGEHDHLIDALRYHFINASKVGLTGGRAY